MNLKKQLLLTCLILSSVCAFAQTADNAFSRPLKDVLTEIQNTYQVSIRYPEELVKDRSVTYAGWRFRSDVEKTLSNILSSQDITFAKEGDRKYKLQPFQYHLKTVEEGKAQLVHLSSLYDSVESWEKRKDSLRSCILEALQLSTLPAKPASAPIRTSIRKMDGYTVENVAIETLPGVYICGSLYRPLKQPKGKMPIVLNPDGHFDKGRCRADCQHRCAMLAKMGALAFSYDLFAWGESQLQFKLADHRKSLAQSMQALNSLRIIDFLSSIKGADTSRIAMTGASGGGSQTMLVTAIDDRIKVSVPTVMVSSYHSGGCPCESGMGVHLCAGGTNNPEIAAMAAPRPQLVISDGKDWTQHVPENEFPYLQRIYGFYGKNELVKNVHLPEEGHDYGLSKRVAMYAFLAEHLGLNLAAVKDKSGNIDESGCTIEEEPALYVFGKNGENLPAHAVKGFEALEAVFKAAIGK